MKPIFYVSIFIAVFTLCDMPVTCECTIVRNDTTIIREVFTKKKMKKKDAKKECSSYNQDPGASGSSTCVLK